MDLESKLERERERITSISPLFAGVEKVALYCTTKRGGGGGPNYVLISLGNRRFASTADDKEKEEVKKTSEKSPEWLT